MKRFAIYFFALVAGQASAEGFPFNLGGPYALTNQHGDIRTQVDPGGQFQLLFFGYANCEQICSAALPMMADIVDAVSDKAAVTPVMITVDPKTDTPEYIGTLTQHHDDFIGLTGSDDDLQIAYDAFSVERKLLFIDPAGQPIYAHGSFIYLLDANGEVLTLIPPVLDVDQAVALITPYISASES